MMESTERAQRAAKSDFPIPLVLVKRIKKSSVPKGGWTWENFNTANGRALVRDMQDVNRRVRLHGMRSLTAALTDVLRGQIERVIDAATGKYRRIYGVRSKAVSIELSAHSALWASAIQEELRLAGFEITAALSPLYQSEVISAYEGINLLLGHEPTRAQLHSVTNDRAAIAEDVGHITHTTRSRLSDTIRDALDEGLTVFDVADQVRERIPQIATNRVPTIVRTEMGRAADQGTKASMFDSETVSHVSVIGCEAVEDNCPTYQGIPTCNIQNVPIHDVDNLEFHINHTGCIVASGFYQADGNPAPLETREGS